MIVTFKPVGSGPPLAGIDSAFQIQRVRLYRYR